MKVHIPTSFTLNGTTIYVVRVEQCTDSAPNIDGQALYGAARIELKKETKHSQDHTEFIFFHELVHHILNMMEEDKLRVNEPFVSRFAHQLHQFTKTAKYGEEPK